MLSTSDSIQVLLLNEWEKPHLRTSPDHFFGKKNALCFAYKDGDLMYATWAHDNTFVYLNDRPLVEIPDINPDHVYHTKMFQYYSRITGILTNKYEWIRGRIVNEGEFVNFWGHIEISEITAVFSVLLKYSVLNQKDIYVVGTTAKTGSKLYQISFMKQIIGNK